MVFEGKVTTDRNVIRKWIEDHDGWPALVNRVSETGIAEVLQIGFLGCENESHFAKITWDEFFERFDKDQLVFLYQEQNGKSNLRRSYNFL